MSRGAWNHNIQYHEIVLTSVPPTCRRALDVGCGQGLLVGQLAGRCEEVIGIDLDRDALTCASAATRSERNITFVEGDVMTHPFLDESFDLITAVAALHHLPLTPALERFRNLLRPGGILAVVGLYRAQTLRDYLLDAVAVPIHWLLRCKHRWVDVGATVQDPSETLSEIRTACDTLPGVIFRQHLLFRYSFVWRKR
jgi:2-polyprenyl-3-methyl-5-hydroxy-6-metoxy-1,4-benzoquinol methylase